MFLRCQLFYFVVNEDEFMRQCIDETITTGNIYAGMVVKNYKVLCGLLGEKVKSGKSKTIQLKEWERFFSYERIPNSNKYKILEVYDIPLVKVRKQKDSTTVRNWTLLDYLAPLLEEGNGVTKVTLTTKDLFLLLGICNEDFYNLSSIALSKLKGKPKNVAFYKKSIFNVINLNDVRSFYDEVNDRGRGLVTTLVKTFNEQCGVEVKKTYHVKADANSKAILATDDEHANIKDAENRVLSSAAYLKKVDGELIPSTMQNIHRKFSQFYADVAKELGKDKVRTIYRFRFTKDILLQLNKYNQLVEGIDKTDTFLNKASCLSHLKKIMTKVWKDSDKYMAIMETKPLTKEVDASIKKNRIVALSQDGARGQKGYVTSRKFLINELIKQSEELEIEEKQSLDSKPDFRPPFPYFKTAA